MGKIIKDGVVYGGSTDGATNAKELNYDNSNIGLDSTNVQDAIDEIHEKSIENIGIEMTLAEYNALPEEEKNSGTYWITDLDNDISGGNSGSNVEVLDNLDSTDPNKALSANMGRQLKEDIDNINNNFVKKYLNASFASDYASIISTNICKIINNTMYVDLLINVIKDIPNGGTVVGFDTGDNIITFNRRHDILIYSSDCVRYLVALKDSQFFTVNGASIPSGVYSFKVTIDLD